MKKILSAFLIILFLAGPAWAGFAGYLKADTAATLKLGPFLDDGDGKTAETLLTISQADVRLSKNGGNFAQKNQADAATHDELGYYNCSIDTTDTNTEGRLLVVVAESGALLVEKTYQVVNANVFDSLYAAATTDYLQVDVEQYDGETAVDTVAGIPDVNVTYWEDDAVPATADANPAVNVEEWNDTDVPADVQAGYPTTIIKDGTGSGEIDTDSGTVLLRSATETQIDNIETDTAAFDTDAEYATAVWNAATNAYGGAGTYGQAAEDILADTGTDGVAMADGVITSAKIATDAIGADELAAGGIDEIWDEVVAELSVGAPAATPKLRNAIMLLYMHLRNARETYTSGASGEQRITNDAGAVITEADFSDDGSTFTKGEYGAVD